MLIKKAMRRLVTSIFLVASIFVASSTSAQQSEKRIALVIGNAAYQVEALPTAANDAGLIAQTLQAAGFDVLGARDLDQDTLRRTFRDFLEKATASGPDTVAFVYLNGYGVQLEGENYFVPVDAKIARDTEVPIEAIRISDYVRPLASLNLKASVVVLDVARAHPFAKAGQPLASGLSLIEPEKGMLIAFNAAPGTVAPREQGPYGAYAQALAEMMRTGGLPLGEVFDRVRLRVNETTKGGEVPWNASKIETPFFFLERAPDAPPPAVSSDQVSSVRSKPIRDLDAQDAYVSALERDTLDGYLDFLAAYPDDPMARRVRAIVAARREALTWRHTRVIDTPQAYWSYLRRYPRGPHVGDARRRLAYLAAEFEPPPSFAEIPYDLPPPPEEEVIYFQRPVLVFDDPDYGFIPPPPPPIFFLPPPPPDFVDLAPPPPAFELFLLPVPVFVPIPEYYNPPVYVAEPPPNVIYNNIHNTVVINNNTNTVTITNPRGQAQTVTPAQALAPQPRSGRQSTPGAAPGALGPPTGASTTSPRPPITPGTPAVGGAAVLAPSLPPSVAQKATKTSEPVSDGSRLTTAAPTASTGADDSAIRTTDAKCWSRCDAAWTVVNTTRATAAGTARATASASARRRAGDCPTDTAARKTASTGADDSAIRTTDAKCWSRCDAAWTVVNTTRATAAGTARATASASARRRAGDCPTDTAARKTASTGADDSAIRTTDAKCWSRCDAAWTVVNTTRATAAGTARATASASARRRAGDCPTDTAAGPTTSAAIGRALRTSTPTSGRGSAPGAFTSTASSGGAPSGSASASCGAPRASTAASSRGASTASSGGAPGGSASASCGAPRASTAAARSCTSTAAARSCTSTAAARSCTSAAAARSCTSAAAAGRAAATAARTTGRQAALSAGSTLLRSRKFVRPS